MSLASWCRFRAGRVVWLLAAVTMVACGVAWTVSGFWHWHLVLPRRDSDGRHVWIEISRGCLEVSRPDLRDMPEWGEERIDRADAPPSRRWRFRPFISPGHYGPYPETDYAWVYIIPLWIPFAFTGTIVLFPLAGRVVRGWHRRAHRCAGCGYDLRGLVGKVCPECGAATGRHPRASA